MITNPHKNSKYLQCPKRFESVNFSLLDFINLLYLVDIGGKQSTAIYIKAPAPVSEHQKSIFLRMF